MLLEKCRMLLRDLGKTTGPNDGTRTLFESILPNELLVAIRDWNEATSGKIEPILVGGLALSFYVKPRYTQDIDYLFLSPNDIPNEVVGFKRTRRYAFQHNKTHVEIELLTNESINVSQELVNKVFATARESNETKIASPTALVAMKLQRLKLQDKADIVELIKTGQVEDLEDWPLTQKQLEAYNELVAIAKEE